MRTQFSAFAVDAADVIILIFVQHAAFRHGAGGDDAGNIPLHQALGGGVVFHLFTDGDLVAFLHQPGDIGVHTVEGDAAHGGLFLLGLAPVPGGEGQVQLPGRQESVLIEHFIEIPQAEEKNTVLVLLFHCPVLPLHGGEVCGGCSHDRSVSAAKGGGRGGY